MCLGSCKVNGKWCDLTLGYWKLLTIMAEPMLCHCAGEPEMGKQSRLPFGFYRAFFSLETHLSYTCLTDWFSHWLYLKHDVILAKRLYGFHSTNWLCLAFFILYFHYLVGNNTLSAKLSAGYLLGICTSGCKKTLALPYHQPLLLTP